MRTLIAGHVTHDRYGNRIRAGGGAYYGAHVHAHMGADVMLVTAVGEDFEHDADLAGLTTQITRVGSTTTFVNEYDSDGRRRQTLEAVAPTVSPPTRQGEWDVLHLAPVMGEVDLAAWTANVSARVVGIGVQGWTRRVNPDSGRVEVAPWPISSDALAPVDVACLSVDELLDHALLDRLRANVGVVAHAGA